MFGYVQPMRPELRVRDMTLYKAWYCGLCKAIKKRYGTAARGVLSYDASLIGLLAAALGDGDVPFKGERCIVSPVRKKPVARGAEALEYAADANVILAYNKLRDDWRDEKSFKAAFGRLLLLRAYRRARRLRPDLSAAVEERIRELSALERAGCARPDEVADVFARLMQDLFAGIRAEKNDARALNWMAYNLGRWVYLMDAWDDLEKDVESGAYNVLWLQYGSKGDAKSCRSAMREKVEFSLKTTLAQCAAAYELLHIKRYKELLDNILYLGLMDMTERILKGEKRLDESV